MLTNLVSAHEKNMVLSCPGGTGLESAFSDCLLAFFFGSVSRTLYSVRLHTPDGSSDNRLFALKKQTFSFVPSSF